MSTHCINCGESMQENKQFTKKSNEETKRYGEVDQGKRGYFITITDRGVGSEEVGYKLTQKLVKIYEAKTGLSGQELADHLALHTDSVTIRYNGKRPTTYWKCSI